MDRRPFYTVDTLSIPLGCHARGTVGKYHTAGTWVYDFHICNGVLRLSNYLIDPVWNTSNAIIYRCRRGNGYYGSKAGHIYQDQYSYFVPSSINNPQGATARAAFATAVSNWRNVLTCDQKQLYYDRARDTRMSGYNLYISEYVSANA